MMKLLRRLVCKLRGHRYDGPAMRHGANVPAEFVPPANATPREAIRLFRAYARLTCRRCGREHPMNPHP